jgi:peroxiredoxin
MDDARTPQQGDRAADFTLPDSLGAPRRLSELVSEPVFEPAMGRSLVLIFYRGYW